MTRPLSLLAGSEAMRGGEAIRRDREARTKFPYVWENAPPASEHLSAWGAALVPAQGSAIEVVSYTVKQNYNAVLRYVMMEFTGAAYLPGDFTFSVTVDKPVLTLIVPEGYTMKDYNAVPFNIGSRAGGPWPIMSGEESILTSGQVVRIVGANVNLTEGTPNYFLGALIGFTWPA